VVKKLKVDPQIMTELLEQPDIREEVARMTPEILSWYKELLVSGGIYARYVTEREQSNG
jgi:hypothetical protein